MDDEILIKLLRLQFNHDRRIEEFNTGKIDFGYFYVDILDVVLDALGIPEDNTLEQIEKYGMEEANQHPDTFCRDWFIFEYSDVVKEGTDKEIIAYLQSVRAALAEE